MNLTSVCSIGATLLAAAFVISTAQAQLPAARVVDRDELRACMSSSSKLAADRQRLSESGRKVRDDARAIGAEVQQLADERPRAEELGGMALDRFNRKAKSHNARMEAARASAEQIGKDEEAFNAATHAYNESCGHISFKPEDREAILKELSPAGK